MESARLKLDRARKHRDDFRDLVEQYRQGQPWKTSCTQHDGYYTAEPVVTTGLPSTASLVLGDCLTNARAALDHIAWGLTEGRRAGIDERSITFPIAERNRGKGDASGGTFCEPQKIVRLFKEGAKLASGPIDAMRRTQPYTPGYEALAALDELVVADKHRLVVLLGSSATARNSTVRIGGTTVTDVCLVTPVETLRGTFVSATGMVPDPLPVTFEAEVSVFIEGYPDRPAEALLTEIIDAAERAVEQFQPYL